MDLLIFLFIGLVWGWLFRGFVAQLRVKRLTDQLAMDAAEIERKMIENTVSIKVEKVENQVLFYDYLDGSFICQGSTRKELSDRYNSIYPTRKGIIYEGVEYWKELQ